MCTRNYFDKLKKSNLILAKKSKNKLLISYKNGSNNVDKPCVTNKPCPLRFGINPIPKTIYF